MPLFFPILIFSAINLASIFYSADKIISLREFVRIISIFVVYCLSYYLIRTWKAFRILIAAILLSSIIPVIFGVGQYFLKKGMSSDISGFSNRIYGTFAHPNSFAAYLLIILSVALFCFLYNRRILFLGAVSFLLFLLGLTYSRSAWLGVILIFLTIGLFKYRKLLVVSAMVILLIYLVVPTVALRVQELFELDPYGSVIWRIKLWKDMIEVFKFRPLTGFGAGTFNVLAESVRGLKFGSLDAHNDYLKILVETGILGLVSYLSLILALLARLKKRLQRTSGDFFVLLKNSYRAKSLIKNNLFALILLALAVSIYTMSFGDNVLKFTAVQWIFWALIGGFLRSSGWKLETGN